MSEQQQPKEHCEHECVCDNFHPEYDPDYQEICNNRDCPHDTRSRPHPAPQATDERYTGVCAVQDKCMEYSDFIESIEEELTEDDMDPPCPINCDKRVHPNAEHDAAIERKAREDENKRVLDEMVKFIAGGCYTGFAASRTERTLWKIESLRQQGGQEQPR